MSFPEFMFPDYTYPDHRFSEFGTGFYIKVRFNALNLTFINLKPTPEACIHCGIGKHVFGGKDVVLLNGFDLLKEKERVQGALGI